MNEFVLDASVAVKWAMPSVVEPLASQAFDLLDRHVHGQLELLVPDLFWIEIANALWKAVRRHQISLETAGEALEKITARDFPTLPSRAILDDALKIAVRYDRAVYDCVYVALAKEKKTDLITADEKLVNAVAGKLPVKWLGAF